MPLRDRELEIDGDLSFSSISGGLSSSPMAATPPNMATVRSLTKYAPQSINPAASSSSSSPPANSIDANINKDDDDNNNKYNSGNHNNNNTVISSSSSSSIDESADSTKSAIGKALAAGISRDEFEKTRAGILSMLRGQNKSGSASPSINPAAFIKTANEAALTTLNRSHSSQDSLPRFLISSRKPSSSNTTARILQNAGQTTPSIASESAPSTSTFRTSVSSSQATDDNLFSPIDGSPPTSEDDNEGKNEQAEADTSNAKSRETDPDSSFNAATAAATVLGMLASSPIKLASSSNLTHHQAYSQHRQSTTSSGFNSSSSPGLSGNLLSPSMGYLATSPASRSPTLHGSSEGGKSTTPVRTRLEDIALKSSAQIRRQRERLGLGEAEMMDLDEDARHQAQIMRVESSGDMENDEEDEEIEQLDHSLSGLAPAFAYQRSPANRIQSISGKTTTHAHRRGPSYDMSRGRGMLDRFMEESSSPKAAQIAKFADPLPTSLDEGETMRRDFEEEEEEQDEFDRSLQSRGLENHTEREEQNCTIPPVQFTPRMLDSNRKVALLRSAGNDLPSPLLAQIRMLSDADYSPVRSSERPLPESLMSSQYRSEHAYAGLGIPGVRSSSSDASATGSARKRKASYDLMSPRQRVMNFESSPSPTCSSPPPPPFPAFAPSSPRYHRPSQANSRGKGSQHMFGSPASPHQRQLPQSQERPLNLFPYNQPTRAQDIPPLQHFQPSQPIVSSQVYHNNYPSPARPPSVGIDYHHHHQHQPQDQEPSSAAKKKEKQKKQRVDSSNSLQSLAIVQQQHSSTPEMPPIMSSSSSSSFSSNFVPLVVQVGQYDARTKPPFSYAALIGQAIFSTPNHRMSLADIYTHIMTIYPFYKKQDAGWQNSIRHNLSLNECFMKTQRAPDEPGKGCLWSVLPGTEEQFTGGNFYKKGKIPKSAKPNGVGSSGNSKRIRKAGSVVSGTESMSVASADDSFDNVSINSSSFVSNSSQMMMMQHQQQQQQYQQMHQQQLYQQHQQQLNHQHQNQHEVQQHHHQQQLPQQFYQNHGPLNLRTQRQVRKSYADDHEEEVFEEEEEEDNSFDMDQQMEESAHLRNEVSSRFSIPVRHQRMPSGNDCYLPQQQPSPQQRPPKQVKQESEPELEETYNTESEYDQSNLLNVGDDHSHAPSDRSASAEPPPMRSPQHVFHTSPIRHKGPPFTRRALLTSPPMMSSPPTNVFARMSQPYQPLRTAFNIPGQSNDHAAALMSSPPPSGIMPSEARLRRLPPPTPRTAAAAKEDFQQASSSIFLPAPNIKPGRTSFNKRGQDEDDEVDQKPVLPPIQMLSPMSTAVAVNTQSPVSSLRASAAHTSSSPSPKPGSLSSSSTNSNKSPTLGRSRLYHSAEVFKTPERFSSSSNSTRLSSPNKLAQLAGNNASKALQALQSTPKLPGARSLVGLVTPGGYYDPYEYGAALDEELERMAARTKDGDVGTRSDRRPLPFPSPLDRTPKWQPWSPW